MISKIHWLMLALIILLALLIFAPSLVFSYIAPETQQNGYGEVLPAIKAEVSGYSSDFEQTDSAPYTTASGLIVSDGTIACPNKLELGTKVRIQGKEYRCEDRMNARYRDGDYFDIWHKDRSSAIEFGRQTLTVVILGNEN